MSQLPPPPSRPWYKHWWLWLLVTLVVIAGIAIAGYRMTAGQPISVDTSQTITATVRDLTKAVSTNGKVAAEHSEQLAFSFGGKVTAVHFKVGDDVNKDDVLAKVGSQQLKAPFDGRVLAVNTFVGNTTTPGVAVFEIGYRTNFVDFIASESEVFDLAAGQAVELTIPTYDNGATTYHGTVELVDTKKTTGDVMNAQTGTSESGYLVRIRPTDLPESAANLIGLTINIKVLVEEKLAALSLERAAIQYNDNDEAYVWLPAVAPELLPIEQVVVTGFEGDDYIEVTAGLQAGDTIILNIPQAETGSIF